ncbi:hypothetical protein GYB29_11220 [bacterium]|jgi:hypothetical protein|nr:hypothetical protein [Balneola sp.]MBR9918221.1 hypothetical protein [bacterium]
MQFNDLQKIWDSQNNKPMYVIREEVLHQKIIAKGRKAGRTANITEWILILTGSTAAGILIYFDFIKDEGNTFSFISVVLFSLITVYGLINRFLRKNKAEGFVRSVLGDLEHALSVSEYQVSLSKGMLYGFWPAVFFISLLSLIMSDKPIWYSIIFGLLFIAVSFLSRWEHRCYVHRRNELAALKKKLTEETL